MADGGGNEQPQQQPPTGQTLREMMFPSNNIMRLMGTVLLEIEGDWELKPTFMQLLPKFTDRPGEDPQRHLQDFEMICGTIRTPEESQREYIQLISFPFSLEGPAREWIYTLPNGSITTWDKLQREFLAKYYPLSRMQNARKEISSIKMNEEESLYDYWCRFKQMLGKCPRHQIADQDLVHFFVKGLRSNERMLVSIACGGCILNKRPSEVFKLIGDLAEETRDMPTTLDEEAFITAPSPSNSEVGVLCSTFKQVVEVMKQTFKKGSSACQSCYGAEQLGDEYQCLTEEEEEAPHAPIIHRGRGQWVGQSNYQVPPGHQPPQGKEPTLVETVHELAQVQQRMM